MPKPHILVVGGGAAGLIAAGTAAENGASVTVVPNPDVVDISSTEVAPTSTVPMYLPLRSTEQRSATALISASLWVMNRMLLPSAARFFMICINSSISCGVNTAVGSSKIRISLSRYNIFRISVLCCIPTVISEIFASGSICNPYLSDRSENP